MFMKKKQQDSDEIHDIAQKTSDAAKDDDDVTDVSYTPVKKKKSKMPFVVAGLIVLLAFGGVAYKYQEQQKIAAARARAAALAKQQEQEQQAPMADFAAMGASDASAPLDTPMGGASEPNMASGPTEQPMDAGATPAPDSDPNASAPRPDIKPSAAPEYDAPAPTVGSNVKAPEPQSEVSRGEAGHECIVYPSKPQKAKKAKVVKKRYNKPVQKAAPVAKPAAPVQRAEPVDEDSGRYQRLF